MLVTVRRYPAAVAIVALGLSLAAPYALATTIGTNVSATGTLSGTSETLSSTLAVTGDTTLASTTVTSLKVSQTGTQLSQVIAGYCVTDATSIAAATADALGRFASTTATYRTCTPSGGVTLSGTSARVLVMATSSLPVNIFVQSASSTAAGLVQVVFANTSTSTASTAIYTLNFLAFQ